MVIAQLVSNFTMYLNPPGQKITLTCHACLRIFRQGWEWYPELLNLRYETYLTEWRFDNPWYHVKIKFNNYFITHFLNNLHKKTPLSKFAKLWEHNTDKGLGNKADLLWSWHDKYNIHHIFGKIIMSTSHATVYRLNALDQSDFSL